MEPEDDPEQEDRDWERLGMDEFFRGYAESDYVYDDPVETDPGEHPAK